MKNKIVIFFIVPLLIALFSLFKPKFVLAGYVNGYYRDNGAYVNGYYRTDPDMYKSNNYSFDNDWSDSYNDNTYYRNYGYDPEPFDDDYVSSYSQDSYYNNLYDDDYDTYDSYDSYDSYNSYDYYDTYSDYDSYDTYDSYDYDSYETDYDYYDW